jgi:hypothetical protein
MHRVLFASLTCILVGAAAGLTAPTATAASPYVIDDIALGATLRPARAYKCRPSEEFAAATSCQRKRQERGRHGSFSATTSLLQARDGAVAYVNREVQPAFFAGDDIEAEIRRLASRFGAPARTTRLPPDEDHPTAVIAVWGSLQLEELDSESRAALETGMLPQQILVVDHLGDLPRSLQLGLPIYRLKDGAGYLWSASNRNGRGYLRFLAIDVAALTGSTDVVRFAPEEDAVTAAVSQEFASTAPRKAAAVAAAVPDLRPFLSHQPTSSMVDPASRPIVKRVAENARQTTVQKTRGDAERARLASAEQWAAEERMKAQLAWARVEAERSEDETTARVKWVVIASVFLLLGIVALLRLMMREEERGAIRRGAE